VSQLANQPPEALDIDMSFVDQQVLAAAPGTETPTKRPQVPYRILECNTIRGSIF
jgi:hypothetical protein